MLADHQRRHNFGGAGDEAPLIGIFLVQHPPGGGIEHDGLLRGNGGDLRHKKDGGHKDRRRPKNRSFHILTRG